jgi:hypothetical protein
MKRIAFLLFILASVMPLAVKAQERGEVSMFGGYAYMRDLDDGAHGWHASVAGNVIKHLALVGDFSGKYSSRVSSPYRFSYRHYGLLFGPRFVTGNKIQPFAHTLFGLLREHTNSTGSLLAHDSSITTNHFGLCLGGGIDVRASDRISIRAIQADFLGHLSNGDLNGGYAQVSVGAVIRLNKSPK